MNRLLSLFLFRFQSLIENVNLITYVFILKYEYISDIHIYIYIPFFFLFFVPFGLLVLFSTLLERIKRKRRILRCARSGNTIKIGGKKWKLKQRCTNACITTIRCLIFENRMFPTTKVQMNFTSKDHFFTHHLWSFTVFLLGNTKKKKKKKWNKSHPKPSPSMSCFILSRSLDTPCGRG